MRTAILAFLAVVAACGGVDPSNRPEPDVTFTVAPTALAAGATVTLTLRNDSSADVGYNLCNSTLARQTDDRWQDVPSDRVCTMELRTLTPGAEDQYPIDLAGSLAPAEYRFHTTIQFIEDATSERITSSPFRITS